ncbi:MAG TPA: adenylate/guanylate cyclase domain-containing protein [Flavipsychrobacter sp.]
MKRQFLFHLLLLLPCIHLYALEQKASVLDSLKGELSYAKEDSNKVQLYYLIAFRYHVINPDSAIIYGNRGVALADKVDWEKGKAKMYNAIGSAYRIKSDYSTALDYFFKSLEINERIGASLGMAYNYGNIGIVYKTQKDYTNALKYYSMALEVYRDMDNRKGISVNLGNIAIIYETLGDYVKSLEYQEQSLKINTEANDVQGTAHNLGNIALLYNAMKKYQLAIDHIFRALAINERLGIVNAMANNYRGIGSIYVSMLKDSTVSTSRKKEIIPEAIIYLKKGLRIGYETGNIKNLMEIHGLLAEVYEWEGSYRNAFEAYREHILFRDSIFSAENAETITGLITKRELDIRDREIQLRNKQIELDKLAVAKKRNERGFFITGIILLSAVSVITFRYYRIQKTSNKLIEKEKEKSERLLHNILPEEVAAELKSRGTTTAQQFDNVTVLFTDFVNFTTAGERMGSQALVEELHSCFKVFDDIMERHGIEKIKTIGDAYLAVCGLPTANERHAEKTVQAAQEIKTFMLQRREQLGDKTFEIRIGVHSGEVVAGIVGVKKFAYDIWGDTVNTAARMEQNSEAGKINISQTTYKLVQDKFTCIYRGELEAKNKGMLKMYFVS